jgi:4-hydroxy-tetrahydrodipicolinate reductase
MNKDSFQITGRYDINNKIQDNLKEIPDIAIEFSTPATVIENIEYLASKKINIVCGTTGWFDKIEKIKNIAAKNDIGFIYASNFSLGVNIFFQVVKEAAKLIDKYESYDAAIQEIHHSQKLDRPSGTALIAAEILLENIKRKKELNKTGEGKIRPEQIDINSLRTGNIFGNHKVIFDSVSDTISVEHNAKSRHGFAEGALLAAKFIYNKKGFYKFEEIFTKLI